MKKLFGVILASLVLVTSLAACGGGAGSSSAVGSGGAGSTSGEAGALTDWNYIESQGKMVIGVTYFAPMNYLDDNGELTGFETEFATAVCEKLGIEPVFQEINWSTKEIELQAKKIDVIWNGMTITPDREENMTISVPYMGNKQVLVVKQDKAAIFGASMAGFTVVAEMESAGEGVCQTDEFFADSVYTPVDLQSKAVMEVAAGTADGAVIDYIASKGMIGPGTDYANLTVVEDLAFAEEEYGIAFRKEDTEFAKKVNDVIAELAADGTLKEIAEKYNIADQLLV